MPATKQKHDDLNIQLSILSQGYQSIFDEQTEINGRIEDINRDVKEIKTRIYNGLSHQMAVVAAWVEVQKQLTADRKEQAALAHEKSILGMRLSHETKTFLLQEGARLVFIILAVKFGLQ